jgi:uncharacterized protein involved in exopolysaccharide biosynthesis
MNDSRYEQNRISGPGGGRLVSAAAGTSSVAQGNGYGSSALGIDPARAIGSSEDMRQKMYDYLRVVIKRKWLIAAIMVATGILGAVHTLMQTPLYASTARLQIDRDMMQVVKGGDVNPVESGSIEFLRTQYELLQGRAMAERVTDALRLGDDPEFLRPRDFSLRAMFQKRSEPGSDTAARAASQRSAAFSAWTAPAPSIHEPP